MKQWVEWRDRNEKKDVKHKSGGGRKWCKWRGWRRRVGIEERNDITTIVADCQDHASHVQCDLCCNVQNIGLLVGKGFFTNFGKLLLHACDYRLVTWWLVISVGVILF